MSDLNAFLAEASSPEPAAAEPENLSPEPTTPEPSAEPEPRAEAAEPADTDTAPEPDQPPEGMDRKAEAIWREERTRRKELQAQVDQMNQRWQALIERMQQQPQQQQPQTPAEQPAAVEVPDFDDDPIGHLAAKNQLLERQLAEIAQTNTQTRQQQLQSQQFEQLRTGVGQMEEAFAKETPDYHDAVGFLYGNVAKMAQAMGYDARYVQQVVSQTAMDITQRALQQGKNPAQAAYEAAKAMGYAVAPPAQADDGAEAPAYTPKPPSSLSTVPGRRTTGGGAPTWDAISKMNDAEFDNFWKEMEKSSKGR